MDNKKKYIILCSCILLFIIVFIFLMAFMIKKVESSIEKNISSTDEIDDSLTLSNINVTDIKGFYITNDKVNKIATLYTKNSDGTSNSLMNYNLGNDNRYYYSIAKYENDILIVEVRDSTNNRVNYFYYNFNVKQKSYKINWFSEVNEVSACYIYNESSNIVVDGNYIYYLLAIYNKKTNVYTYEIREKNITSGITRTLSTEGKGIIVEFEKSGDYLYYIITKSSKCEYKNLCSSYLYRYNVNTDDNTLVDDKVYDNQNNYNTYNIDYLRVYNGVLVYDRKVLNSDGTYQDTWYKYVNDKKVLIASNISYNNFIYYNNDTNTLFYINDDII